MKIRHFLIFIQLNIALAETLTNEGAIDLTDLPQKVHNLANPIQYYLLGVDYLGVHELEMLKLTMMFFEPEILWRLVQQSVKRARVYRELTGMNRLVYNILFSSLTIFCAHKMFDYAFKTLEMIENQVAIDEDPQSAILIPYYRGYIYYFSGEEEKAMPLFLKTIKICDALGLKEASKECRDGMIHAKEMKESGRPLIKIFV